MPTLSIPFVVIYVKKLFLATYVVLYFKVSFSRMNSRNAAVLGISICPKQRKYVQYSSGVMLDSGYFGPNPIFYGCILG
jgi:hypothetical protein